MEEKKVYSIVGKVEIGTDEYRDLIEGLAKARIEADRNNSERWREYSRADEAEKTIKELKPKYEKLLSFINSSEELKAKYRLFCIESEEEA